MMNSPSPAVKENRDKCRVKTRRLFATAHVRQAGTVIRGKSGLSEFPLTENMHGMFAMDGNLQTHIPVLGADLTQV